MYVTCQTKAHSFFRWQQTISKEQSYDIKTRDNINGVQWQFGRLLLFPVVSMHVAVDNNKKSFLAESKSFDRWSDIRNPLGNLPETSKSILAKWRVQFKGSEAQSKFLLKALSVVERAR
jgi:hypothetical protein